MARNSAFARLPRFERGAFVLFAVAAVLTALLGDQPTGQALMLSPGGVIQGKGLWQPLTASFIFPEGRGGGLVFTLVIQWFFAGTLESFWGTRKYMTLVLGCSVAGYVLVTGAAAVVPAAAAVTVGGTGPVDVAAITAFGVLHGKRPMQLLGFVPLSGRGIAFLAGAVAILSPLARGGAWPEILPMLTAAVGALLVTTQPWRGLRSSGKVRGRKARKARHLQVVPDEPRLLN